MKSILALFLFVPAFLFSQENTELKNSIVEHPDKEASYPGGPVAMKQFIADKISYPKVALKNGEYGKVFVEFVVNTDGSISDAKILRGTSKALNDEAIRVVNIMPNWEPAQLGNENVRTLCRVPFNFHLKGKSSDKSGEVEE